MVKRRRSWLRRYFTSGGRIAANEFAAMIRPFLRRYFTLPTS